MISFLSRRLYETRYLGKKSGNIQQVVTQTHRAEESNALESKSQRKMLVKANDEA